MHIKLNHLIYSFYVQLLEWGHGFFIEKLCKKKYFRSLFDSLAIRLLTFDVNCGDKWQKPGEWIHIKRSQASQKTTKNTNSIYTAMTRLGIFYFSGGCSTLILFTVTQLRFGILNIAIRIQRLISINVSAGTIVVFSFYQLIQYSLTVYVTYDFN